MLERRSFIRLFGGGVLGTLAKFDTDRVRGFLSSYAPGVQLFTLMNIIDQDTVGTLTKLAALGYKNIESAFSRQGGFYGLSAKEFSALSKDLGLAWRAHHVIGAPLQLPPGRKLPKDKDGNPIKLPKMMNLKEHHQQLIADAAEGGIEYLVCANIPTNTPEQVSEACDILNQTAEACKKVGLQLVYHNHDWEFIQVGDRTPYEALLSEVPADMMQMELDLAWVTKAGVDPIELFKQHPGRFPLWHVKDIAEDMLTLKPVGQGHIDFRRIFNYADLAGLKYPFVEHDRPKDGIGSLEISIEYLQTEIF